ncbi:insertion element IS476 uncharacterized 39.2 kDa protein-like (plasmid) [Acetobacter orientalis]|uniref:Insertion element IS476 uncharacterized 39.2 kDa protein-like n=1 Tax=Acetobacter orientalis TaxID=146474 RepID=A0A2Z5ZNB9_9PROT|nr:insertion element IS476 uncharacterized 39.2 kDa protein-like [Acetobacter orientalis]
MVLALPNIVWSLDFMAVRLLDGRAFRLLNIMDDLIVKDWRLRLIFLCRPVGCSAAWNRLWSEVAGQKLSDWIMVLNMSVTRWIYGLKNRGLP